MQDIRRMIGVDLVNHVYYNVVYPDNSQIHNDFHYGENLSGFDKLVNDTYFCLRYEMEEFLETY